MILMIGSAERDAHLLQHSPENQAGHIRLLPEMPRRRQQREKSQSQPAQRPTGWTPKEEKAVNHDSFHNLRCSSDVLRA